MHCLRLLCLMVRDVCKIDGLLACDISDQDTFNRHAFPRPRTQHGIECTRSRAELHNMLRLPWGL